MSKLDDAQKMLDGVLGPAKAKSLDIWQRAPAVVIVSAIGLLLVCGAAAYCFIGGGDEIDAMLDDMEDVVEAAEDADKMSDVAEQMASLLPKMQQIKKTRPPETWKPEQMARATKLSYRWAEEAERLVEAESNNVMEDFQRSMDKLSP